MTEPDRSNPNWRENIMGMVAPKKGSDRTHLEQRNMALKLPISLIMAIDEGAKLRGMTRNSYMRRCLAAVAVHDTGVDWFDLMLDEPRARDFGQRGIVNGEHDFGDELHGHGRGAWRIDEMGDYDAPAG